LSQAQIALNHLTRSSPFALMLPREMFRDQIESLDEALALAANGNAAIATALANEEAARQDRKVQTAQFSPVLNFELTSTKSRNSGGLMGWRSDLRAMFVLNLPLFSGGADHYRKRAALAREQQFELERREAQQQARQNLLILYNGLAAAQQKIDSLNKQISAQA